MVLYGFRLVCVLFLGVTALWFSPIRTSAGAGISPFYLYGPRPNPELRGTFGEVIVPLANGNIVITDPRYTVPGPVQMINAGAVFLYDGRTFELISMLTGDHQGAGLGVLIVPLTNGNFLVWGETRLGGIGEPKQSLVRFCSGVTGCSGQISLATSMTGNDPDDFVGQVITPLANGNYVLGSALWDNGSLENVGAVTFCSGTTGCTGVVSPENSLIGGNTNDQVGGYCDPCPRGIVALPNGNYVVSNVRWNGERGAVTFGNGTTGVTGVVSAANSLVGSEPGDRIGDSGLPVEIGITPLSNGDYIVRSTKWNTSRGAVTRCSGVSPCAGVVSAGNSLVGSTIADRVGTTVVPVGNGNVVIASPTFDRPGAQDAGHATFCSTSCTGTISLANSLTSDRGFDKIGSTVKRLANGNYIVAMPDWNVAQGAVTFGSGSTGVAGPISAANSLIGPQSGDAVGKVVTPLPNGDYVVGSEEWGFFRGAATLANGTTGTVGTATAANSLIGTTNGAIGDRIGSGVIALANSNYVVVSHRWNLRRGSATFCTALSGCAGQVVSQQNSLVGANPDDEISVSTQRVVALVNGNYVVNSGNWSDDRGAVTWGDGTVGTSGVVSAANSLVGSTPGDTIGYDGVVALMNGNYTVTSHKWWNGPMRRAGAVSFGPGSGGLVGPVTAQNSLIGLSEDDMIGYDSNREGTGGAVTALPNGGYVLKNRYWDNGNENNAAAVTFAGADGVTGPVTPQNSIINEHSPINRYFFHVYDDVNDQVLVAQADLSRIVVVRLSPVNVSGRVLTPDGRAIRNALVVLIDGSGARQTATTSSFGAYSFPDLNPGATYTISVSSKRYRFAPRTIVMNSNLTDVDLQGLE